MYAKLCADTKVDGTSCRAVAVTGSHLCHAHKRLNQRSRRLQRVHCTPGTRLGTLADRRAILRALSRVLQATASGALNPYRAAELIERIRLASDALPPKPSPAQTNP
jgi:hypothetical protein